LTTNLRIDVRPKPKTFDPQIKKIQLSAAQIHWKSNMLRVNLDDEFRSSVKKLLDAGKTEQALGLLTGTKGQSQWKQNAIAVCQIRLGNPKKALEIYRQLIVSGIDFTPDTPPVYKINFALTLLLTDNYDGFSSTLSSVDAREHAGKSELLAIAREWRSKFNLMQSALFWTFGVLPKIPIDIGPSAGYVE